MTTGLSRTTDSPPMDAKTGLTLPLSKHLGSRALAEHRAMLAMECEYLAKKFDRFGWERERNTSAQDRQKLDFMDALQDYPLAEVRAACKSAVLANPNKMPNEGHIRAQILTARAEIVARHPKAQPAELPRKVVDKDTAQSILEQAGYAPKKFGGAA